MLSHIPPELFDIVAEIVLGASPFSHAKWVKRSVLFGDPKEDQCGSESRGFWVDMGDKVPLATHARHNLTPEGAECDKKRFWKEMIPGSKEPVYLAIGPSFKEKRPPPLCEKDTGTDGSEGDDESTDSEEAPSQEELAIEPVGVLIEESQASQQASHDSVFDSGTKSHVVSSESYLEPGSAYPSETHVRVVGGELIKTSIRGKVVLAQVSGPGSKLELEEVIVVPGGDLNLISISRLDRDGCRFVIESGVLTCTSELGDVLCVGVLRGDGLYHLRKPPPGYSLGVSEQLVREKVLAVGIQAKFEARPYVSKRSDEVETPEETLRVVSRFLKRVQKKVGRRLTIWDPFVCKGRSGRFWESEGFGVIHNSVRDFYDPKGPEKGLDYDFLVTCPPFSETKHFFKRLAFEDSYAVLLVNDTISRKMFKFYDAEFIFQQQEIKFFRSEV